MRADMRVGATFPDYELADQTGKRRKLSELQGSDPMILVLSRGHYCPKDRRQLGNHVDFYPEVKVSYARIVTVSTDSLLETNEFRDGLGAQWPFLSDPGRTVQKDLDIQEHTDPQHDPMIPHTLVLEPGLGVDHQSPTCMRTCGKSRGRFVPIGTWVTHSCVRSGTVARRTASGHMGGR